MSIKLTTFEEIRTGHVAGPIPWSLDQERLDAALSEYGQWRPPYAGTDADGRRIIPPCVSVGPAVAASPYRFRGIAAGVELHNHGHLYQDRSYTIDLHVDEKFEKRGRQYIWFRAAFGDGDRVVHEYRWLQVLSPVAHVDVATDVEITDVRDADAGRLNEFPYVEPSAVVRDPSWRLHEGRGADATGYLPAVPEPGTELVPNATLFTWRKARDYAEWRRRRTGEHPGSAAYSVHSHSAAAREIGLDAANISGANLVPFLTDLIASAFGDRWLTGGSLSVRFLKPVGLTDYFVVHGRVEDSSASASTVAVRGENQAGDQVLVGSASILRHGREG